MAEIRVRFPIETINRIEQVTGDKITLGGNKLVTKILDELENQRDKIAQKEVNPN